MLDMKRMSASVYGCRTLSARALAMAVSSPRSLLAGRGEGCATPREEPLHAAVANVAVRTAVIQRPGDGTMLIVVLGCGRSRTLNLRLNDSRRDVCAVEM